MSQEPNSDEALQKFWTLFDYHWLHGAGSGTPNAKWRMKDFLDAMTRARCIVSSDIVCYWTQHRNFPSPRTKDGISAVFFPRNTAESGFGSITIDRSRQAFEDAWIAARRSRAAIKPADFDDITGIEWGPERGHLSEGLAEVSLHPLRTTNSEDHYRIMASAIFGVLERDDVEIGLKDVHLRVTTEGYQIAQNSMIGESVSHPHPYLSRVEGGLRITGPTDKLGRLSGSPFGDDHLAVLEP